MNTLQDIPTEALLTELERRRQQIDEALRVLRAKPDFDEVVAAVCQSFGVSEASLFAPSRLIVICLPRQAARTLLRTAKDWTFAAIGEAFRMDHGTAMHAVRTQQSRMMDATYARRFRTAEELLKKAA